MSNERIKVDVEEIMREIRAKAHAAELADNMPAFDSISVKNSNWEMNVSTNAGSVSFDESIRQVNLRYDIPYYWDFGPGFKTFFKRVVRKLNKCLLLPIVDKLREFNSYVVQCLNFIYTFMEEQRRLNNENREENRQLREQLDEQMRKLQKAQNCVTTLEEQQNQTHAHIRELQDKTDRYVNALIEVQDKIWVLEREGAFVSAAQDTNAVKMSASQSGEDMILEYIIGSLHRDPARETYLDLGANHAKYLSNTYFFYKRGARGVLVEANPSLISELKFYRSGDVILNRCISDTSEQEMNFYVLTNDGLSTPDKEGAEAAMAENPAVKLDKVIPIKSITVEEIIATYFDSTPTILNLDIEGKEMEILNSIDFTQHRPLIIIIETIPYRKHLVVGEKNHELVAFMKSRNYIEYAFTGINSIFLDLEQVKECLPQSEK